MLSVGFLFTSLTTSQPAALGTSTGGIQTHVHISYGAAARPADIIPHDRIKTRQNFFYFCLIGSEESDRGGGGEGSGRESAADKMIRSRRRRMKHRASRTEEGGA